jgi:hypothetical protein
MIPLIGTFLSAVKFPSSLPRTVPWFTGSSRKTFSKIDRLARRELEYEHELDSTSEPRLPTAVDCQRHFWHLRSGEAA